MNRIRSLLIFIPLVIFATGCFSAKNDNSDLASESLGPPSDIDVNCTPALSPNCNITSDGSETYFIWASISCEDFISGFGNEDIGAVKSSSLSCVASGCAATASVPWASLESENTVITLPTDVTTAAAWLNFTDNGAGDGDGPQAGDVICCVEDQTADVKLTNTDCIPIT